MRVSLREVAEKAGVSFSTVSRVLNNADVKISEETRERVRQAALDLGYQPNRAAQSLVTGRTNIIALVVAAITSAHSARLISTAMKEIRKHGYDVVISEMNYQSDMVVNTPKLLALSEDAAIFCDLLHGVIPGLEGSLLWGKPFINLGAYVNKSVDFIHIELKQPTIQAIQHLHSIGCKRIAYMVPDWLDWFNNDKDARLFGYMEAMEAIGKPAEYILTPASERISAGVLRAYIERNGVPDGIFAFNDEMGIGALRMLQDIGLSVPEDVALVSCDGIEETAYHNPRISTIVMPIADMFNNAWEFLTNRLNTPDIPLQQLTMPAYLHIRASSKR